MRLIRLSRASVASVGHLREVPVRDLGTPAADGATQFVHLRWAGFVPDDVGELEGEHFEPTSSVISVSAVLGGETNRKEIIRCLKRHIVPQIYRLLTNPEQCSPTHPAPGCRHHRHPGRPGSRNSPGPNLRTVTRPLPQPPASNPIPDLVPPTRRPRPRFGNHRSIPTPVTPNT